jgi:Fe-S oxidoreductase
MLDERRAALETCGYCPKLCRSACPVSNVEASEALIPWGKMAITWYAARGDVKPDQELSLLPWGCTGCFACRDRCEHKNPVAETLRAARASYGDLGFRPPGAVAAESRRRARAGRLRKVARKLSTEDAGTALVIGCGYLTLARSEAAEAVRAARALFGPVSVISGCCGLAAREAGDPEQADREGAELLRAVAGRRLVAVDAGCALELRSAGAVTLIEAAASHLDAMAPTFRGAGPMRWHDPCRLGRGLGLTAEPRRLLERALGEPPAEFEHRGKDAICSGAGGLLPFSMPRTARAIARERIEEHERLGGGTIVTGCAASLAWLRAQGARVTDIVSVLARSLSGE